MKIKVPAHVMRKYKEDEKARIQKNQELRQALSEHDSEQRQALKKQQDAELKKSLKEYNDGRIADGRKAKAEIKLYQDEAFPYSLHLAKQRLSNRIEVLELDKKHYTSEVKRLKATEADTGERYSLTIELTDTLNRINEDLDELRIDAELFDD